MSMENRATWKRNRRVIGAIAFVLPFLGVLEFLASFIAAVYLVCTLVCTRKSGPQ